jgi:outer membrane murein-binding lipoprotein Lpp
MIKLRLPALLIGAAVLAGCQSSAQMLAEDQGTASQVAARRGQFEMSCQQVTTDVLSSNLLQPVLWNGLERAEYTVGVAGCGQRRTYIVVCQVGSPSCFAAAGRF